MRKWQEHSASRPSRTEHTPAGEQHTIPGAERIPSAELAKRRTTESLKPKTKQKPADHGLFSDENKQTDLIDRANVRR